MLPREIDVVLMAGGKGSTMGNLTKTRQKLMLPVNSKPILMHILDEVVNAFGSARVILSTGYRAEDISSSLGNHYRNLDLVYVHDPNVSGTRAGSLFTNNNIQGPFLYLGGDIIAHYSQLISVTNAYNFFKPEGVLGVIAGATKHEPALKHGLLAADERGRVTDFIVEPPPIWSGTKYRDIHIAYFDKKIYAYMSDAPAQFTIMEEVVSYAIKQGETFMLSIYNDNWYHFKAPGDINVNITYETRQ